MLPSSFRAKRLAACSVFLNCCERIIRCAGIEDGQRRAQGARRSGALGASRRIMPFRRSGVRAHRRETHLVGRGAMKRNTTGGTLAETVHGLVAVGVIARVEAHRVET
jgi:hypothetical protein